MGSGAILISLLLKRKEAQGLGVDISEGAVAVARKNAKNLGVTDRSEIIVSDLLKRCLKAASLISSFPIHPTFPKGSGRPFSGSAEGTLWAHLTAGKTALIFTVASCGKAWLILRKMACLLLKWGIGEGAAAADLLVQNGCGAARVFLDYAGIDRMVLAAKKGTTYADKIMETGN